MTLPTSSCSRMMIKELEVIKRIDDNETKNCFALDGFEWRLQNRCALEPAYAGCPFQEDERDFNDELFDWCSVTLDFKKRVQRLVTR